jgi:CHASE2 domain-containing sensor protein
LFDNIRSRPILIALVLIAICILVYCVGAFYHQFINNPLDFASLVFIVVIYVGAIYHQVRGFERR